MRPRFTSSARALKCAWQALMSLQVFRIAMTGLPFQSSASKPIWRKRERWPNERRSSTPSQRWERSASGDLRVFIGPAAGKVGQRRFVPLLVARRAKIAP